MRRTNWTSVTHFFSGSDDSTFLRLSNDGESADIVFLGDPKPRSVHWVSSLPVDCNGPGCGLCKVTLAKTRLTIDVALQRDGMWIPKTLEQAPPFFLQLKLTDEKHPIDRWMLRITRRGGAGDRNTRYQITPVRELTGAELTVLERLQALSAGDEQGDAVGG